MRRLILAGLLLAFTSSVFASNNINIQGLAQQEFSDLSQDMGAVLNYKPLQGASSEGLTGFDISVNGGWTKVAHESAWNAATNNTSISGVPFADVRVSKGLPFGFDIGGEYSAVPGSNIKLYGVEGRYAILDGGAVEPAIGIRAAYTHVTGVNNLSFNTKSLGLSISKGFGPLTPYAGIGEVWTNSTPDASTGLQGVSFTNAQVFVGAQFNFGIHMAVEASRLSGNTTYSLKFGFGF